MSANLLLIACLLAAPLAAAGTECDCTHFPWQPEPPCVETCGGTLLAKGAVDELTAVLKVDRDATVKLLAEAMTGQPVSFQNSLARVSAAQRGQFWHALSSLQSPSLERLFSSPPEDCHGFVYPQSYGFPSYYYCTPVYSMDDRISAQVIIQIEKETSVPLSWINVSTKGGVVTISGTVGNSADLVEIGNLVGSVPEVKSSRLTDLKVEQRQKRPFFSPSLPVTPDTDSKLAALCVKERAWTAYFQNEEGELAPVRKTWNTDRDEDWLGLRFTDFEGPRIRLGVLGVVDRSAEAGKAPVSEFQEMLTSALHDTKRLDILERKDIQKIETQQVLEPNPAALVEIGKGLGTQYLVYGAVDEWLPEHDFRGIGPGFFKPKKKTEVAITFMLADAASGTLIFRTSERVQLDASRSTSREAVQAVANKAAFRIATFLLDRKWRGTVVDVKGADVYINAGSQQGMARGIRLSVQAVRGIIKDPESGMALGEDLFGIGTLEVVNVQSGFSIARVVEGGAEIKTGDRVELAIEPVPPRAIPECAALDTSQNP